MAPIDLGHAHVCLGFFMWLIAILDNFIEELKIKE